MERARGLLLRAGSSAEGTSACVNVSYYKRSFHRYGDSVVGPILGLSLNSNLIFLISPVENSLRLKISLKLAGILQAGQKKS
ncbi:hypothetical protein [Paenibacillus lemnae]|uniref:Uncharacterized protein n=1 Tax=Paenibacillus lemnae TaxID=1330551 RepID=A0A848M867_PAELE|nr:hypothetical protein [Paenibacillus lemnae]NMO95724.1 hypothetical protein [Paenibacillus lemnae]